MRSWLYAALTTLAGVGCLATPAQAARIEFRFEGTVRQVSTFQTPPAFASVQAGDSYSLSAVFDELARDECSVGCRDWWVVSEYALESMTVVIGSESYTWLDRPIMLLFDDESLRAPPGEPRDFSRSRAARSGTTGAATPTSCTPSCRSRTSPSRR